MEWFKSLNIKYKFGLLNLFALGILAGLSFVNTNRLAKISVYMNDEINQLSIHTNSLVADLLLANNDKVNFIKDFDKAYLDDIHKNVESALEHLKVIKSLPAVKDKSSLLENLEAQIRSFESNLGQVTSSYVKMGKKDDGVIGEFRQITHEVESTLKDSKNDSVLVSLLMIRRHEKDFLLRKDNSYVGKMDSEVEKMKAKLSNLNASTAKEVSTKIDAYNKMFKLVVESSSMIDKGEEQISNNLLVLDQLSAELKSFANVTLKESETEFRGIITQSKSVLIISTLVLILISSFISAMISNGILNKVRQSVIALSELSDETSEQSSTLKTQAIQLNEASIEQAAATQETSASMAEMESMIKTTASEATKGNQKIKEIADLTDKSTRSAEDLKKSMEELAGSKEDLERVLQVIESVSEKTQIINDIVFKTQLLSFNASIEAARAGQYGRGFSVVAEEISQLANTSGNAARDIEQLTSQGVTQVKNVVETVNTRLDKGNVLSLQLIESFNLLHQNMNSTLQSIDSITNATEEQKLGIEQTNQAMAQLDATVTMFSNSATSISGSSETLQKNTISISREIDNIKSSILGIRSDKAPIAHAEPSKDLKKKLSSLSKKKNFVINDEDEISADDFERSA